MKKAAKKFYLLLMAAVLMTMFFAWSVSADEAEVTDGWSANKKAYYQNGEMVKDQLVVIDGDRYYFNANGKKVTKRLKNINGKQYYFQKDGKATVGLEFVKGKFYFFTKSGRLNVSRTKKINKNNKYEGNFTAMKKYLGTPVKTEYLDSCYGSGKDVVLTYKYCTVTTFKGDNGKWLFLGAY